MTDLIDAVQDDGIDDSLVELFEVKSPDETTTYYLFNGLDDGTDKIEFRTNDYFAIPIQIDGIEMTSTGAAPRPTLSVANIPALTKTLTSSSEELLYDIRVALNFETNEQTFVAPDHFHDSVIATDFCAVFENQYVYLLYGENYFYNLATGLNQEFQWCLAKNTDFGTTAKS